MSDMASMLAPPPGWTPPDSGSPGPQSVAAPLPTENTPPVSVSTTSPDQVATATPQPSTATIQPETTPAYQDPEMVMGAAHQGWLGQLLHAANSEMSTLLGGDQTIHVTKHQDGNYTVTHDPSTTGEKWARVAQAVLGGVAAGMANGQGPGGPARAAAAGIQTGLAQAPNALAAANAQASQMNKQQLDAANQALLHQKVFQATWDTQHLPQEWAQTQAIRSADFIAKMEEIGATPVAANLRNAGDVADYGQSNPSAVDGHLSKPGAPQLVTYPNGNGGVMAWTIPTSTGNQMYDKPWEWDIDSLDKNHPGQVVTEHHVTDANQDTVTNHSTRMMALYTHNDAVRKQAADIANAAQGHLPKTGPEAIIQSNLPGQDPAAQAAYAKSAQQIGQQQIAEKIAGRTPAAGAPGDYQQLAADLNSGNVDISQIRTRRDWPQMYAAARQYAIDNGLPAFDPATASAKYKARAQTIGAYSGNGQAAQKIQGFSTLLEHLGDMSDNADELRRTNSPYLNKPINTLDRDLAGGTQVGPAELRTSAPAHEFANVLSNNRALNNQEKEDAAKSLNVNMTPAQLQGNAKQMARTSVERLAPVFQAYREAANGQESPTQLTPRAMQTLRNMGLGDFAMQEMHGQSATPTGPIPNQPVIPAGAQIGRKNGQIVGYSLNGKWTQF